MIIKPIRNGKKSSAKEMARYNEHGSLKEQKEEQKKQGSNYIPKGRIVYQNIVSALDYEKVADQMEAVTQNFYSNNPKTKLQNPYYSAVISFAPEDELNDDMLEDIIKGYAENMGFSDNQFCVWEHTDKGHRHFHILMNRINPENESIWEDSHSKVKGIEYAKFVESKYPGLRQVKRVKLKNAKVPKAALNQKKKNPKFNYGTNTFENVIKYKILQALSKSKTITELKAYLKEQNISIKDGFGMVFIDDKTGKTLNYKQLGNDFSRKEILNTLENNNKFGLKESTIKAPLHTKEVEKESGYETDEALKAPSISSPSSSPSESPKGKVGKRVWETEEEAERRRKKGVR